MRIGVVYKPRREWPKFQWVHDALRSLGHSVRHVQTMDELREADRECDVILFEQREPGPGRKEIVRYAPQRCARWVQWWFDLFISQPYQGLVDLYGDLARCMDTVLVKERDGLQKYRDLGICAVYSDQGVPYVLPRIDARCEFDVALFGSRRGVYRERIGDVTALRDAGYRVIWAGDGGNAPTGVVDVPPVRFDDLPAFLSRAAVCLCVDFRHDIDGYWSDRLWMAAACGAAILRRWSPGVPDMHVFLYEDAAGAVATLRSLRTDPDLRRIAGDEAQAEAYRHTYAEIIRGWL